MAACPQFSAAYQNLEIEIVVQRGKAATKKDVHLRRGKALSLPGRRAGTGPGPYIAAENFLRKARKTCQIVVQRGKAAIKEEDSRRTSRAAKVGSRRRQSSARDAWEQTDSSDRSDHSDKKIARHPALAEIPEID